MKIAISYKSDRMELSVHARFSRVKGTISNPPRQQHKPEHPEQARLGVLPRCAKNTLLLLKTSNGR
jgi:hypothetical protein